METDLNLNFFQRSISHKLEEALLQTVIPNIIAADDDLGLVSLWIMILKSENRMVADICFYGPSDASGQVEIGYGTYADFQGQGLMTEALGGLLKWLESQPKIKIVIATTDSKNPSSLAVLSKNDLVMTQKENNQFYLLRPIIR